MKNARLKNALRRAWISYPRYHSNCGSRRPFRLSVKPFCPYAADSGRFYLLPLSSFRLRSYSHRSRPAARTVRRVSVLRDSAALSFKAFIGSLRFSPPLVNSRGRFLLFLSCMPERQGRSVSFPLYETMPDAVQKQAQLSFLYSRGDRPVAFLNASPK